MVKRFPTFDLDSTQRTQNKIRKLEHNIHTGNIQNVKEMVR